MKLLRWLDKHFESALLTAMLILLTGLVLLQIVMRYVLGSPLTWSEELCRVLLVWSGFLSIGYCIRNGTTIKLDTVVMLLPKVLQRIMAILTTLIMLALLCYLLRGAWDLVLANIKMGSLMAGLGISSAWLYAGPLVGIALGILRLIQSLILTRGFQVKLEDPTEGGD
ncbi:MAG: TRAP transporter small permease [Pseudoflavonifractor sp.]